jgi:hypothetical protein
VISWFQNLLSNSSCTATVSKFASKFNLYRYTAANNCAAACMYTKDLRGGIRVLEEALTCHPTATAQHETLVLNLCSMYELAGAVPTAAKRSLANWVLHVAPDDLDPACTRL